MYSNANNFGINKDNKNRRKKNYDYQAKKKFKQEKHINNVQKNNENIIRWKRQANEQEEVVVVRKKKQGEIDSSVREIDTIKTIVFKHKL